VRVAAANQFSVHRPQAMFQQIIYQGLAGDAFVRNFTASYDIANRRMVFAELTR
jgi:hypothetical protein